MHRTGLRMVVAVPPPPPLPPAPKGSKGSATSSNNISSDSEADKMASPSPTPTPPLSYYSNSSHSKDEDEDGSGQVSSPESTRKSHRFRQLHAQLSSRKTADTDVYLSLKALCRMCRRPTPSSPELHGFTFKSYADQGAQWLPCLIEVVRRPGDDGTMAVRISAGRNCDNLDLFRIDRGFVDISSITEMELFTGSRKTVVMWHKPAMGHSNASNAHPVKELMLSTESGFALCFQSWVRLDNFVRLVTSYPSGRTICVVEDGERAPCAGTGDGPWHCVAYAVVIRSGHGARGSKAGHVRLHLDKKRIEVILDADNRALEAADLTGSQSGGFRCDASLTERRALLLSTPHMKKGRPRLHAHLKRNHVPSKQPYDLVFPSVAARERFIGRIRAIQIEAGAENALVSSPAAHPTLKKGGSMRNMEFRKSFLDANAGVEQEKAMMRILAGSARFNIFATTWNLGDTVVPTETVLRGWLLPAGTDSKDLAHDIIAIGLQECAVKHRDAWLKGIEAVLDGGRVGDDAYTVVEVASHVRDAHNCCSPKVPHRLCEQCHP